MPDLHPQLIIDARTKEGEDGSSGAVNDKSHGISSRFIHPLGGGDSEGQDVIGVHGFTFGGGIVPGVAGAGYGSASDGGIVCAKGDLFQLDCGEIVGCSSTD